MHVQKSRYSAVLPLILFISFRMSKTSSFQKMEYEAAVRLGCFKVWMQVLIRLLKNLLIVF